MFEATQKCTANSGAKTAKEQGWFRPGFGTSDCQEARTPRGQIGKYPGKVFPCLALVCCKAELFVKDKGPEIVPSLCNSDTKLASPNSGNLPNREGPQETRSMRRPSELGTPRQLSCKNCCDCTLAPASLKLVAKLLPKAFFGQPWVLLQKLQQTMWSPSTSSLH